MELYSKRTGAGDPLLLIHGIMCDHTYFDEAARILSSDYKVITYDRRGYGIEVSEKPTSFDLEAQAMDALEVVSGEEGLYVAGHSAGSLVALKMALTAPKLIKGMLLIEPGLMFDEAAAEELRIWNEELNGYARARALKKAMQAFTDRTGPAVSSKQQGKNFSDMKRGFNNLTNFMYGELNDIQLCDFEKEDLLSVPCPIVIGISERESIFSRAAERSAEILGWPVIRITGSHNAPSENPMEFADAVRNVLGGFKDALGS